MDEVPPVVFQPIDAGDGEYAIVIDRGDAPYLRDILRRAAEEYGKKARTAVQWRAQARNEHMENLLVKYADRCEHVRKAEVRRVSALLRSEKGDT